MTEHEKGVLMFLVENGKTTDKDIARSLDITSQAVGKIRKKLERSGIIKGYSVNLDYELMDLTAFAVILARLTQDGWNYKGGIGIQEKIANNPNIISIYRVPEGQITHIILCAFRNLKELDKYMHILQSQYSEYLELTKTYVFSNSSIIKESINGLVKKVLHEEGKERMPEPIPFGRMIGEE